MISASEALRLPSAQLSDEDRAAADALESAIDSHVRAKMQRHGAEYQTEEKRPAVIAEVVHRLRCAGWAPDVRAIMQQGKFSANAFHMGYQFTLVPTDESCRAAEARGAA